MNLTFVRDKKVQFILKLNLANIFWLNLVQHSKQLNSSSKCCLCGAYIIRSSHPEVFSKKRCSEKFPKIHKKTPVPEYLFNKVAGQDFIKKETLVQVFSRKFCEIFKACNLLK